MARDQNSCRTVAIGFIDRSTRNSTLFGRPVAGFP